jgi:hypothetical protein
MEYVVPSRNGSHWSEGLCDDSKLFHIAVKQPTIWIANLLLIVWEYQHLHITPTSQLLGETVGSVHISQ